ncbi:MAG: alpha/beta fold hydrolase [Candidatus Limnocylindrales bacterium]
MTFQADETGLLDVSGATLSWASTGRGPALLLIHAGIADQGMWDGDVPALAADHRVVTYDCRGFGRSASADVEFSNRADIAALLDHLGIERASVVGISRGGQIALDFTLEYPERVTALVLVAAGLGGMQVDVRPDEQALFDQGEAMWLAKDWEGAADLDVRIWVDGIGQAPDRVASAVREKVRDMALATYRAEYPEGQPIVLAPPAAGRLAEVRVPTLVVHGDLDVSSTTPVAEALEQGIVGARRVSIAGVAHMVNMEHPAEFQRLVLDFLADAGV